MNLVPVAYKYIRLTFVELSSDICYLFDYKRADESTTTVRRLNLSIMNTKSVYIKN